MTIRVSVNFLNEDSDAELLVHTSRVITGLTGNPVFPDPDPSLPQIGAARTALSDAIAKDDGGSVSGGVRRAARGTLVGLLRPLGDYLQFKSKGDYDKLLTTNYPLQKIRHAAGPVTTPAVPRLSRPGHSGQLFARVSAVDHATAYLWRYARVDAPESWTEQPEPTTAASVVLENLTPGVKYLVECKAVGSQGASDWSDPATLMCV